MVDHLNRKMSCEILRLRTEHEDEDVDSEVMASERVGYIATCVNDVATRREFMSSLSQKISNLLRKRDQTPCQQLLAQHGLPLLV